MPFLRLFARAARWASLSLATLLPFSLHAEDAANVLQSIRQLSPTGEGTFNRPELFSRQENVQDWQQGTTLRPGNWISRIHEYVSASAYVRSDMLLTNNVFDGEPPSGDVVFTQYAGVGLEATWRDLSLSTTFDNALFRYANRANASYDTNASTVSQTLYYQRSFWNKKIGLDLGATWQFTDYNGRYRAEQWAFRPSAQVTWLPNDWVAFSLAYSLTYYQTPGSTENNEFLHDTGLSVSFSPLDSLSITPSFDFTIEEYTRTGETALSIIPTLAISWTPLEFFEITAVGSYAKSVSSAADSGYHVFAGTLSARLFFTW